MAALNPLTRELVFKIVFYGPGLGGKTTTLQHIHATTKPENRGNLVSLATPTDRTLYFDFLPIRVAKIRGMSVRLQLFTVPGQVYYSATRKLVLTGADGVVFVADSQTARAEANQESLEDLNTNLADHGRALSQIPHTFQWNKRDLPDVLSTGELDRRFNLFSAPSTGTSATTGDGIFEGLEDITRLVMEAYRAELPKGEGDLITSLTSDEGGIAEAVRGLAESRGGSKRASEAKNGGPAARHDGGRSNRPTTAASALPPLPAKAAETVSAPPGHAAETVSAPPHGPVPEQGEIEKRPTSVPSGPAFSLAGLFREEEGGLAAQVEERLAHGDAAAALLAADLLMTRVLAGSGGLVGPIDAPRDPGLVVLLLGLDGRRYIAMRTSIRAARATAEGAEAPSLAEARAAYTFCLELARARDQVVK